MYLLVAARKRAKEAGVPFNLKHADIVIPSVCPVLGIPLLFKDPTRVASITLDRVIPELGYVRGNVCVISGKANRIKNDATLAELEAVVRYVRRETSK